MHAHVQAPRATAVAGQSQRVAITVGPPSRGSKLSAASATTADPQAEVHPAKAWSQLKGLQVIRASDGAQLELTSLWGEQERCVLSFARSLG